MGKIWSFIKSLKIEPYLFIHMFANSVAGVTGSLLLQDKICVNLYNQSNVYCTDLTTIKPSDDPGGYKDQILSTSTQFGLYSTILTTLPAVIWSLFIGSWTDKYVHGRKILLCLSSIGGIVSSSFQILNSIYFKWSPYYLLLNSLTSSLTGGWMASMMAIYSYVTVNTPENRRSIRFALIEFSFFLGGPLGTYVGGLILRDTPDSSSGQLHNYVTVIGASLISQIIAFLLLLFLINEKKPTEDTQSLVNNQLDINKNRISVQEEDSCSTFVSENKVEDSHKWYYPLKLLFDTENIKDVWICCTKKRENQARRQIWIMLLSMCVMLMAGMGGGQIQFQFSEKVYYWSAVFYSNVNSISSIVHSVLMTISVPIFVVRLKLFDTQLGILGILSSSFKNIIIGSYQYPIGYYVSVVIGSISGLTTIAIRAKLSKLVTKEEVGKVFSLLATLESVTPLIASLFFTFLFEWSLNFYPGLTFEVCGAFMIIPLVLIIWVDLKTLQT